MINNIEVNKSVTLNIRDDKDSFVKVTFTHNYHDGKGRVVNSDFRRFDNQGELMWKFVGNFDVDQLAELFTLKPHQQSKIFDPQQSGISMYTYDVADKHGNNQHYIMLYDYYGEHAIGLSRGDGVKLGDLLKIVKSYYYEFERRRK